MKKRKNDNYGFLLLIIFLYFVFISTNLSAQEQEQLPVIEHTPISSFVHGETVIIEAQGKTALEWMRFFFRYEGVEQFQVRNMQKVETNSYTYEFDTSQVPGLEFEYYLVAKEKEKIANFPVNAPDDLFGVTGTSEESLPEISEEFPSPQTEEKKFRLPMSISGSVQTKVKEKESIAGEKKTLAGGNIRVFTNFQKGGFITDYDSNFNYSNTPAPGDKNIDLSNMILSISKDNHTLKAGDISINESEFTVSGLGRRGMEYVFTNQRAYFHLFDVSSQQPKGFKGFGIPKSNMSILGGAVGYKFLNDLISLKAIYLSGKDDPQQGVNIMASSYFQRRKGNVISLVEETGLFQNRLNLKAEFARSDFDGDLGDTEEAVSDNAWNIGGGLSYGMISIGANYRYIGKKFNPIGYQYFTNNRKGYETNIGFNIGTINLSGAYNVQQDNVDNDPKEYTTKNKDGSVSLSWGILSNISLNIGYRRSKQDTFQEEMVTTLQDSLTQEYSGGINFTFGSSANFNVSVINSELSSKNYPESDSTTLTVNLGGSLRSGQFIAFNPTLGYTRMTNKFTNEKTHTYNSFITTEITFIPQLFTTSFSGSFTRTEAAFGISNTLNINGNINLYLTNLIKIIDMTLALRSNYSQSEIAGVSTSFYSITVQTDFSF